MPVVKMSSSINKRLGHEHGLENTFVFRNKNGIRLLWHKKKTQSRHFLKTFRKKEITGIM